jgi:hypothetical protein
VIGVVIDFFIISSVPRWALIAIPGGLAWALYRGEYQRHTKD